MLGPFQRRDAERAIGYANHVLERELSLEEVKKIAHWFHTCDSSKEFAGQRRLLDYVALVYPARVKEFEEYFRKEQEFWDGPGSLI